MIRPVSALFITGLFVTLEVAGAQLGTQFAIR